MSEKQSSADQLEISFDGKVLTLIGGDNCFHFPAVSGRPGIYPPIPEGQYRIESHDLWCNWMRPSASYRITLHAESTNDSPAVGCFIHSNSEVGNKGSINLPFGIDIFVADLKMLLGNNRSCQIYLSVQYPKDVPPADPTPTSKPELNRALLRLDRLKGHVPESLLNDIANSAEGYEITSILRLAHFLAQSHVETGRFKDLYENLRYREIPIKGFMKASKSEPKYTSKQYLGHPTRIASLKYASRYGNGNEASGDGYKYRGRGYLHLTWKDNYKAFAKYIGDDTIEDNPDLVATKYPLRSAIFFFKWREAWSLCDLGATDAVVRKVSIKVNGGVNGLAERKKAFHFYYKLLTQELEDV